MTTHNVVDLSNAISPCESIKAHTKHDWVEVHDSSPEKAYLKHCDGISAISSYLYEAILDIIGSGLMDNAAMSEEKAFEIAEGLTVNIAMHIAYDAKNKGKSND